MDVCIYEYMKGMYLENKIFLSKGNQICITPSKVEEHINIYSWKVQYGEHNMTLSRGAMKVTFMSEKCNFK